MNISNFPFEIKAVTDAGEFEGIAARYANVDYGGDVLMAGSFAEFDWTADRKIRILAQHNQSDVIGKGAIFESGEGLAIKAKLNLAVAKAQEIYSLLRDRTLDALSVGYSILPNGAELKNGVRYLKRLRLHEVSIVTFPMNEFARIAAVKTRPQDIREFESRIRDEFQLSAREAKRMASAGWSALNRQPDDDEGEAVVRISIQHGDVADSAASGEAQYEPDFSALIDRCAHFSKLLKKGIL